MGLRREHKKYIQLNTHLAAHDGHPCDLLKKSEPVYGITIKQKIL